MLFNITTASILNNYHSPFRFFRNTTHRLFLVPEKNDFFNDLTRSMEK